MAEALLGQQARERGRDSKVGSAGIGALVGHPPPEAAIELMAERGLDISGHRARQIDEKTARAHELILVMEREQQRVIEDWWPMLRGRVLRLGEWRNEDVVDPYQQPREAFERSLAQIEGGIEDWMTRLFQ